MSHQNDHIFLDDEREPSMVTWMSIDYSSINWKIIRNYESFIETIEEHFPLIISLDNDLQTEKEGYLNCLKWLANYCMDNNKQLPQLYFHTKNQVALENMKAYIKSFEKVNDGKKK